LSSIISQPGFSHKLTKTSSGTYQFRPDGEEGGWWVVLLCHNNILSFWFWGLLPVTTTMFDNE
jgi:hypothetical protein